MNGNIYFIFHTILTYEINNLLFRIILYIVDRYVTNSKIQL